jgi:hypothetical protein
MRIEPTQWHVSFARLFVAASLLAATRQFRLRDYF